MKLYLDKELFSDAIKATSRELGIAPEFVEKDYWICHILQNLSRHPYAERIVWKGGTSLSKAYGLIKRFSSDVDFAVLLEGLSQNRQKKLVARIGKEITADLEEFDMPGQTIKNNRFRKTYHAYDSLIVDNKESLAFLGNHVIVEINTYGNPYPYERRSIRSFIAEMMEQRGLPDMILEMDMGPFELNVLDKRRTLCEKMVSLIRFSFEDDTVAGVASKIRHFYDLHFLMQDGDCIEYLNGEFSQDLLDLIAHDKAEFDRPPLWKTAEIKDSVLFTDFDGLWRKVAPKYISEVGALTFGEIPTPIQIEESMTRLLQMVKEALQYQD